jgi:hypothetical protein
MVAFKEERGFLFREDLSSADFGILRIDEVSDVAMARAVREG